MADRTELLSLCANLTELRLPRWNELPDLELYMDQVLSLIQRYLGSYPGFDGKGLTASMVNNYVKLGVMPPPGKKKYVRTHLAHLIMICVLKASLPIDLIKDLISESMSVQGESEQYDAFCTQFETSIRNCAEAAKEDLTTSGIYRAALYAQAEQALAMKLYEIHRKNNG